MKTAVLANLNANTWAVREIERHARSRGVDRFLVAGGLFDYGPTPVEVARWVLGTCDGYTLSYRDRMIQSPRCLVGDGSAPRLRAALWNLHALHVADDGDLVRRLLEHQSRSLDLSDGLTVSAIDEALPKPGLSLAGIKMSVGELASGKTFAFHHELDEIDRRALFGEPQRSRICSGFGQHWLMSATGEQGSWPRGRIAIDSLPSPFALDSGCAGGRIFPCHEALISYLVVDDDHLTPHLLPYDSQAMLDAVRDRPGTIPWDLFARDKDRRSVRFAIDTLER